MFSDKIDDELCHEDAHIGELVMKVHDEIVIEVMEE